MFTNACLYIKLQKTNRPHNPKPARRPFNCFVHFVLIASKGRKSHFCQYLNNKSINKSYQRFCFRKKPQFSPFDMDWSLPSGHKNTAEHQFQCRVFLPVFSCVQKTKEGSEWEDKSWVQTVLIRLVTGCNEVRVAAVTLRWRFTEKWRGPVVFPGGRQWRWIYWVILERNGWREWWGMLRVWCWVGVNKQGCLRRNFLSKEKPLKWTVLWLSTCCFW